MNNAVCICGESELFHISSVKDNQDRVKRHNTLHPECRCPQIKKLEDELRTHKMGGGV